jgi:hypothetical protein
MKRHGTERNGMPVAWTRWMIFWVAMYLACVATYFIPGWSVVEVMYP